MTVRVLCRPELAPGFELAGLAPVHAEHGVAAAQAIARLCAEAGTGIILIDDALYRELPRDFISRLDREALPILAPVPVPRWDERAVAEAYVMDILRQAIGYRVRPR